MTARRVSILALVGLSLLGCEEPASTPPPTTPPPTPGDAIPEVSIADVASLTAPSALEAPLGATRVGMLLTLRDADGTIPALRARGVDAEGVPGEWVPFEITWREGAQVVGRAELGALWFGAELDVPPAAAPEVAHLTWSALVPSATAERAPRDDGDEGVDIGASRAALRTDIAALGVHSREEWGARAPVCSTADPAKNRIAIHHTVTDPNTEPTAALRGIQSYHIDTRGWCDVGYHFLVSLDGRVWEGRIVDQLGSHVANNNTGNIGISFLGCFHPNDGCEVYSPQMPPDSLITAGAAFVAGIAGIYGIPVNATNVKGHRDHTGASTSCPGDYLYARLDELRSGTVTPPADVYAATWVQQTFPLASEPFELAPLEEVQGFFEMRNSGTATWQPGEVFLATTQPRDVDSPLVGPDWYSAHRLATVDRTTAPGEMGRFSFTVKAPLAPGDYPQFLGLVREGVTWFSDAGQGGPPDDQLQIRVTVLDTTPWMPPGTDAGAPMIRDAGAPMTSDAGPGEPMDGGCNCRAAVGSRRTAYGWLGVVVPIALVVRRRRRV